MAKTAADFEKIIHAGATPIADCPLPLTHTASAC